MEPQKVTKQGETVWIIDPRHTTIEFTIRNLFFFTLKGRFTDIAGTIKRDDADISRSSVEASVLAASIDTDNRRRDDHLRSTDFLDSKRYPRIIFQSEQVERGRDRDALRIRGILTIRGKSREIEINVTEVDHSRSPQGEEVAYYGAVIEINRFDFGIRYRRWPIGRRVKIEAYIQAVRQD
ncbi:MAG: YceI family protein [Acidobacteriota bacterium]